MIEDNTLSTNSNPENKEAFISSSKSKIFALIEVLIVRFLLYGGLAYGFLYLWEHIWHQDPTNWVILQYFIGLLWFIVPILIISIFQKDFSSFGIKPKNGSYSVNLGMNAFVVLLIVNFGYLILMFLSLHFSSPFGSMVITGCFIIAFFLIFTTKKNKIEEQQEATKKLKSNLIIIPILLALPIVLSVFMNKFSQTLMLTVIWQFIFSGFGEEFFFRSYIQTRLNKAFGKPFQFRGIQFGPGLIITAALFAITHILNTYSIFIGVGYLSWGWGLFTFVGGLIFGLLREKSEDLYACGIAHGMEAVGEGLALLF
jgi:hypothetical protein